MTVGTEQVMVLLGDMDTLTGVVLVGTMVVTVDEHPVVVLVTTHV